MNSSKRAKYRARAKITGQKWRAKMEGKTQGKGKGKTTNYYFPMTDMFLRNCIFLRSCST